MSRFVTALLLLAAACGGATTSSQRPRIADPIPMVEGPPPAGTELASVTPAEPAPEPTPAVVEPPPVHDHDHHHDHDPPAPPVPTEAPPPPVVKKPAVARVKPAPPVRFAISVTRAGFEPKNVVVPRGKPVILTFERRIERTCGTEVVMTVDGKKIEKDLPLNQPVELAITFRTAGTVKYSCSMDMIRGSITVQ